MVEWVALEYTDDQILYKQQYGHSLLCDIFLDLCLYCDRTERTDRK